MPGNDLEQAAMLTHGEPLVGAVILGRHSVHVSP